MKRAKIFFKILFFVILILLPLNFYIIGNEMGRGIQWAIFRYQESIYGTMIITIADELRYVSMGIIHGKSAVSLVLWATAAILLMSVCIFAVLFWLIKRRIDDKFLGGITIGIGFIFLISCILQYGLIFYGPSGLCFPFGVPVIWGVGILIYTQYFTGTDNGEMLSEIDAGFHQLEEDPKENGNEI
jgi:hypothetical protein